MSHGFPAAIRGPPKRAAQAFIAWLTQLKATLGIPAKLSDYRGPRALSNADIPRLVAIATADICHQTNPRKCTAADFEQTLRLGVLSPRCLVASPPC